MSESLAATLSKAMSTMLTDLAHGKYTAEIAKVETLLTVAGPVGVDIERALQLFLWINHMTAPAGKIVPDGQGGWVPESNSRYDPKTGEFL